MTELEKIKSFYNKVIGGLVLFILTETGVLIWILSHLDTQVSNNKEDIIRVEDIVNKNVESTIDYFRS